MLLAKEKAFRVSLDALSDMRDYVAVVAAGLPINKKKLYKLQLAVDEIATNIISYSGLSGEDVNILITAKVLDQSLVLQVKDQGVPFDPLHKLETNQVCLNKPAAERRIGGLGIYLAVTGADKFSYEYRDGFNVNQFVMNFDAASC